MTDKVRVAAAQFHIGSCIETNLTTCERIIKEAAAQHPDLLVLPEFCNHCSWYDSAEHCYEVAVELNGEFMQAIVAAVQRQGAYVVINCTVRRAGGLVTGTSLMISPEGQILGENNKQILIGHENDFLQPASDAGPIVTTPFGRLAMYSCMDGVINETPRSHSLRGAQLLCNSLNSFALDEGDLHIPVRAAENKVWVVAANKVGPLLPEELIPAVSAAVSIPAHCLDGAGDSQIVSPQGEVLARAGKGEETIVADIDIGMADNKLRPDGTDIFTSRRGELYAALGEDPQEQPMPVFKGPELVTVAILEPGQGAGEGTREVTGESSGESALKNQAEKCLVLLDEALSAGVQLVCLPGLYAGVTDLDEACAVSAKLIAKVTARVNDQNWVAVPKVVVDEEGVVFSTVLIGAEGICLDQPMLHQSKRYPDARLGDHVKTINTLLGRLGVVAGDDAIYPETMRLLALEGVAAAMIPLAVLESWEVRLGLVERSAENRVNIVAAGQVPGDGIITCLQREFTIMTPWQERPFDGLLSCPEFLRAKDGRNLTTFIIHPLAASNKECSQNTDLLSDRPWRLLKALTA